MEGGERWEMEPTQFDDLRIGCECNHDVVLSIRSKFGIHGLMLLDEGSQFMMCFFVVLFSQQRNETLTHCYE